MAMENLILMATGVVNAAKTSRSAAIKAAKTEVLTEVKDTVVDEAIKEALGVDNGAADLAKASDVTAVTAQAESNAAAIGNIEDEIGVITTNVQAKANSADVYTKEEVDAKVSAIPKFGIEVVESLPAVADAADDKIYLVRTADQVGSNIFTEYILVNSVFEQLGTQELDLSGYATKAELDDYVLKNTILPGGVFQNKKTNQDGSYALLFNESDGGGAQYSNADGTLSYVGVNDGGADGVSVQIYSKNKTSNSGVRINVSASKAYYTKGANTTLNGGNEDNEIAVKADIPDVSGFANSADVYTKAEVDAAINAAIADVLEQMRTEFGN